MGHSAWEIVCLVCTVLQGVAAGLYLAKEWFQWRADRKGSKMIQFNPRHPLVLAVLIGGALLTGVIGLWLVFHPPITAAVSSPGGIVATPHPQTTPRDLAKPTIPSPPTIVTSAPKVPRPKPIGRVKLPAPNPGSPAPQPTPIQPQITVNADNNSGNVAGVNNGQMSTTNNYGVQRPPPSITWGQFPIKPGAPDFLNGLDPGPNAENPGVGVNITVGGLFTSPAFIVQCSAPCMVATAAVEGSSSFVPYGVTGAPNTAVVMFTLPAQMLPSQHATLTLRSMNSTPITLVDVKGYISPNPK